MSEEWAYLPLLPLRCILEHLGVEDALAATSTCRHWRQAIQLYEGRKEKLTLRAKNIERTMFLTRMFRKHTKKLHIYINCNVDQLNKFLTYMLPQYFEAHQLQEVVFVGPIYIQQNPAVPYAKLKRIIIESLVFKNSHFIQKLAFMGCEMCSSNDDTDRFAHKHVEYYSKQLSFGCVTSPADAVLSRRNVEMMMFSTLKHIAFEYDCISTETLKTLSQLRNLILLSLNVVYKRQKALPKVDWQRVNASFNRELNVAVNIISMPHKKFKAVIENVLVEGMSLISLKVMFCKTIYIALISHVCYLYNNTLQELVWADSPHEGAECARPIRCKPDQVLLAEVYNQVDPFILLCWQCGNLRRLAIHGYWVWEYDLLGYVRLRKSLKLEVSSLYADQDRFGEGAQYAECMYRVMHYDAPSSVSPKYIEVNIYSDWEWRPYSWDRLHPGLKIRSTPENRASYIAKEVLKPLGVT